MADRLGKGKGHLSGYPDNLINVLRCLQMSTEFRVYNPQSLGSAVRYFREEAGLSQVELAGRVGIHRSYLSDLERGQVTEQLGRLVRILEQLGARITVTKADW